MWRRRLCFAVISLTLALTAMAQEGNLEDRLKATYIYNFLQFVDWPSQAFSDASHLTVCVVGPAFESVLQETVRNETVGNRTITVKTTSASDAVHGCQVIYIRESLGKTATDLLGAIRNSPVLTVGDSKEFIEKGGIIRFIKAENHIRFEINPGAAERASLTLSSRLLRLADIVPDPFRKAP
jgi:YfiR/HmsC-like